MDIRIWRFYLFYGFNYFTSLGVAFYLSNVKCLEKLYNPDNPSKWYTNRYGRGCGIFLKLKGKRGWIYPYIRIEIGITREYRNTSLWEWNDKLIVSLIGIYLGIKTKIGGIK